MERRSPPENSHLQYRGTRGLSQGTAQGLKTGSPYLGVPHLPQLPSCRCWRPSQKAKAIGWSLLGTCSPPPHPGQGRGQPQSHATSAWTLLERDVSSSPRPPPTPKQPHCAEAFIILGTPSLPGGGDLAQPLMCPCEPGWAIGGEFPKWARRGGKSVPAAHSRSPPWGGGAAARGEDPGTACSWLAGWLTRWPAGCTP